jgi:ligand-binding SRPBCC domain-containing protein
VVFAFLQRPANRVRLAPPHWCLQLLNGPERIELGSRLVFRGRRKGISQTSEMEVTGFEQDRRMEEEQRRGPFRRWKQTFTFEPTPEGGTQLKEEIDWEGPGGMLGLLLTSAVVEHELDELRAYRQPLLLRLLQEETAAGS